MIPSPAMYNPIEDVGGDNLLALEIEPLLGNLAKSQPGMLHYTCPAFVSNFKNTFIVRSYFDVTIEIESLNRSINVLDKNKEFANKYFMNRHGDSTPDADMILTLNQLLLFITDDDIEIELMPCYYHHNDFTNKTMLVTGRFNIKNWIRSVEAAVIVRDSKTTNVNSITIDVKRGDPLYYIRFHCKDNSKVTLQQELDFKKIEEYIQYTSITNGVKRIKPHTKLPELYEMFSRFRPKKFFNKCPFGFK
jgi:hypothetical protein